MIPREKPVKVIDRQLGATSTTGGRGACQVPGCLNTTRELKPFCIEHIRQGDYPSQLLAALERRKQECQLIGHRRWPGNDSIYVSDALGYINSAETEVAASILAKAIDLDFELTLNLLNLMSRHGLIRIRKNKRGSVFARPR